VSRFISLSVVFGNELASTWKTLFFYNVWVCSLSSFIQLITNSSGLQMFLISCNSFKYLLIYSILIFELFSKWVLSIRLTFISILYVIIYQKLIILCSWLLYYFIVYRYCYCWFCSFFCCCCDQSPCTSFLSMLNIFFFWYGQFDKFNY
jgi:hypothetical protein